MTLTTTSPLTGTWTVDAGASTVGFAVRHFGVATVRGSFAVLHGGLDAGTRELTAAGELDVASVDTGNRIRDDRLRAELFATDAFPTARIAWTDASHGLRLGRRVLRAELTIRDVTCTVPFDVEIEPRDENRLHVRLDATIRQSDFGLEWDALREAGRRLVSDRVRITADVVLVHAAG